MTLRWIFAPVLCGLVPAMAAADPGDLHIEETWGATADVHDVAVVGDRTLVATSGGLIERRGGKVVRVMTARDGLPGTRLRSVSVTPEGVWVGAVEGAALLIWDEAGVARVVRSLALPRVRRAVTFGVATYFATFGQGLQRLGRAPGARTERIELGRSPSLARLTDLAVAGGVLWIASAGGGVARLAQDGTVLPRLAQAQGLASDLVWELEAVDQGERVLVGTASGLSAVTERGVQRDAPEAALARALPVRDIRSVRLAAGALWVATFGAGAYRIVAGERPERIAARDCVRARVMAQAERGIVVGHDGGLARTDTDGRGARNLATGGLSSPDITSLAFAFGKLWMGTFDRGLVVLTNGRPASVDRAVERWHIDRRVNDLDATRDASGRETLWIATDRGLYEHDGRRFSPAMGAGAPSEEHASDLHVDPRTGDLWVASSRRLSRRDRLGRWTSWTGQGDSVIRPFAQLSAVTTDARGGVWVGSLHGLYRLDPASGAIERHTVSSGALPVDWVTALSPWRDGVVAGTYHGGLVWFDGRAFRAERATTAPHWVNPHAFGVVQGALWVGTLESGLHVGAAGGWAALGTTQGLPSQDVTAILAGPDGSAWVATRGGLARVRRVSSPAVVP